MRASPQYAARLETAAVAAMAGLLADHKDHAEECKEGETCAEAVARLAVEHGVELLKAIDAEVKLQESEETKL